jgi:hypothetical protein
LSEAILEEMQQRLMEKGAFDRFKRKKDEEMYGEMEMKVTQLQKRIADREKEEPLLEIEASSGTLSETEADELSRFFIKKEIDDLSRKFPVIDAKSSKCNNLIKLSELGYVPKKPKRFVSCMKCGITKDVSPISMVDFWVKKDKFYCESCEKELDDLNKTQTQMSLIRP